MPHKKPKKRKIYRKYQDFYSAKDLIDPDAQKRLSISINDFDARGHLENPSNPCVVTTIDPDYIKHAKLQLTVKKFRMKTDILRVREITRNKFVMYSSEQRFIAKKFESEHNDKIFQQFEEFHKVLEQQLNNMEKEAFEEMVDTHKELQRVQSINISDELKEIKEQHQRVLMEVQMAYTRFLFLLKLICYFDNRVLDSEILKSSNGENFTLCHPPEIFQLTIGCKGFVTQAEMDLVNKYMSEVIRPYLAQRNFLNADIWLEGFERNRRKISNFNRRFSQLALLNHIFTVIHNKFEKTYKQITEPPVCLQNPAYLEIRLEDLQLRAQRLVKGFQEKQIKDKFSLRLRGVVPIVLHNIRTNMCKRQHGNAVHPTSSQVARNDEQKAKNTTNLELTDQHSVLIQVEDIQRIVQNLLSKMDKLPIALIKPIEKRVRRETHAERQMSRRALIKQNRLQNWIIHFKKHFAQKE